MSRIQFAIFSLPSIIGNMLAFILLINDVRLPQKLLTLSFLSLRNDGSLPPYLLGLSVYCIVVSAFLRWDYCTPNKAILYIWYIIYIPLEIVGMVQGKASYILICTVMAIFLYIRGINLKEDEY